MSMTLSCVRQNASAYHTCTNKQSFLLNADVYTLVLFISQHLKHTFVTSYSQVFMFLLDTCRKGKALSCPSFHGLFFEVAESDVAKEWYHPRRLWTLNTNHKFATCHERKPNLKWRSSSWRTFLQPERNLVWCTSKAFLCVFKVSDWVALSFCQLYNRIILQTFFAVSRPPVTDSGWRVCVGHNFAICSSKYVAGDKHYEKLHSRWKRRQWTPPPNN